jgi:hypothetical protein
MQMSEAFVRDNERRKFVAAVILRKENREASTDELKTAYLKCWDVSWSHARTYCTAQRSNKFTN